MTTSEYNSKINAGVAITEAVSSSQTPLRYTQLLAEYPLCFVARPPQIEAGFDLKRRSDEASERSAKLNARLSGIRDDAGMLLSLYEILSLVLAIVAIYIAWKSGKDNRK